jgi:hypothetical protein
LVSALPGAVVHELLGVALPSEGAEVIVPVVLPATEPMMVTGIAAGRLVDSVLVDPAIADGTIGIAMLPNGLVVAVGFAGTAALVDVTLWTEGESSTTRGEQLTLVPGIVGSVASGGEASVVTGAPGTVAAEKRLENGPGPLRGDETIAPGVVGSAIAVLPIVDTCASQRLLTTNSASVMQRSVRISDLLRPGARRLIMNSPARAAARLSGRR